MLQQIQHMAMAFARHFVKGGVEHQIKLFFAIEIQRWVILHKISMGQRGGEYPGLSAQKCGVFCAIQPKKGRIRQVSKKPQPSMAENDTPGGFHIKKIKTAQGLEKIRIIKQIRQRINSQNSLFFRKAGLFEDLQKMT